MVRPGLLEPVRVSAVVRFAIVRWVALGVVLLAVARASAQTPTTVADPLAQWVAVAEKLVPTEPAGFTADKLAELAKAAEAIELWTIQKTTWTTMPSAATALTAVRSVLDANQRVDRLLDRTLEVRTKFAGESSAEVDRDAIRSYLRCTSRLIDLSGRLRYLQFDALLNLGNQGTTTLEQRQRLVNLLTEYRSSIGASVAAGFLLAPPPQQPPPQSRSSREPPPPVESPAPLQAAVLRLFAAAGDTAQLVAIAKFLEQPTLAPELVLLSAETIRTLGLPQSPRADTPADLPKPAITPRQLRDRLARLPPTRLTPDQRSRQAKLLAWLDERMSRGLTEAKYQFGRVTVEPGDWLLMRNPSPYNLFTDLAPGLFTHVGVVALEKGDDGVARMVIVDLPERGSEMPATNVDVFLERTLHYVFLRHPDHEAAAAMGEAARQTIGSEIEFDLNFRTDRVLALKSQKLDGKKVKTYCAGLLLLCALQTTHERSEFFPLDEYAADGRTSENIARLGMSIGADFVSPTGALFARSLQIVGQREPMYDPAREIEEAIFDHFAARITTDELQPTPDLFNSLRIRVAEASRANRLLAEALAATAGVSANMDLVSAAKAAAVVATLDEVAFGSSAEFNAARDAIRGGSLDALRRAGASAEKIAAADKYRRRHAELVAQFENRQLSPRKLRVQLVEFYTAAGRRAIDRRFYGAPEE